jgi:hypothetical protein
MFADSLYCTNYLILHKHFVILAVFQHWQAAHIGSVAGSVLMLNGTLFGCLPTLYASWKPRHLKGLVT